MPMIIAESLFKNDSEITYKLLSLLYISENRYFTDKMLKLFKFRAIPYISHTGKREH